MLSVDEASQVARDFAITELRWRSDGLQLNGVWAGANGTLVVNIWHPQQPLVDTPLFVVSASGEVSLEVEPPEMGEQLWPENLTAGGNPNQARVPKGNPKGGQWLDTPSGLIDQVEVMMPAGPSTGERISGHGEWTWDEEKGNWVHPKNGEANDAASAFLTKEWERDYKRLHPPANPDGTVSEAEKELMDLASRRAVNDLYGPEGLRMYTGLFSYAGMPVSFTLNSTKRKGKVPDELVELDTKLHQEVRLTGAPRDMPVFRSISNVTMTDTGAERIIPDGDDLGGLTYYDAGYQSCSTNLDYALDWKQGDSAVVMEITIPKGAPMLTNGPEYEVIIPDGSTLKLGKSRIYTTVNGRQVRIVQARLAKVSP